ncbi:tetratricopeptide repeat protein [Myxacorys almedinensis]|uniref:TPR repeat-containing protein n=1 Tax=Myxacorys almedinensis A TaxID=2690445 RepID=A0A8J7YYP0_9CYAN|nr:hypothetical protein [Myxacorys almedinensis]NDJ15805.1 hypothetical protein [Myxacorys almedinensis A]
MGYKKAAIAVRNLTHPWIWLSAFVGLLMLSGQEGQASGVDVPIAQSSLQPAIPPRKQQSDKFPPSPLELTAPDPLLPGGLQRPLTEAERQQLARSLDELNQQATAKLQANDPIAAFEIWNRELRLRRALGLLEEIKALGRVGDQAWTQNLTEQVRVITNRLRAIQTAAQNPGTAEQMQLRAALGIAYQQVRSPGLAVEVYTLMLAEARAQNDPIQEASLLTTIGQLHLSWFDYPNAIATYTQLLNLAQARNDQQSIFINLIQLAYVHNQAKQPAQAAIYQQQLLDLYQQNGQAQFIPALKIQLADDYAATGRFDLAEQQYREAFELAQPLLQTAYATDALQKLGKLYQKEERLEAALQVYAYLAQADQQAYNAYSAMDAFDQIGQIQLAQKAYPEAIAAFRQGLEVSKQLNYRTDYFNEQIQKVSQQGSR